MTDLGAATTPAGLLGNIHGGEIVKLADSTAGPAVTAALDELAFLAPETEEEVRRMREAEIRRAHRLARKEEIEAARSRS